jgi:hypothetical protein
MFGKLFGAALAASLVCANAAQAQPQDCSLKQIASLPMTTTASGKIAVPAKIDGTDRLLAVELNASISGIDKNAIDALELDTHPIPGAQVPSDLTNIIFTPGEAVFIYSDEVFTKGVLTSILRKVSLPDLQIGAFDIKDFSVTAMPAWDVDGIAGILGTGILQHFDMELDFANARMNLYSQDHCAGKVVYWANQYAAIPLAINPLTGEIMVPATLDGGALTVTLATDPGHSFMSRSIAAKIVGASFDSSAATPIVHFDPYGRDWVHYPFKMLSLGGLGLQNPQIDLFSDDYCTQTKLHGPIYVLAAKDSENLCKSDAVIELAELKHLHLYFAFGEKKLYVTAADAHR